MYYGDFFRDLMKKGNSGVLAYILINALIMVTVFCLIWPGPRGVLIGLCVYIVSVVIALSAVGETILRFISGCEKITDPDDIRRIDTIATDVYNKVKIIAPSVPKDVEFYILESEELNAFATGRKTICITRSLLEMPDDYIKAVVGHEFGHLVHHDTAIMLLVTVGNMFMNLVFLIVRVVVITFVAICGAAASKDGKTTIGETIALAISTGIINITIAAWTYFGLLLVNSSSRKNEFAADKFSWQCGYGDVLLGFLKELYALEREEKRGKKKKRFENPLNSALLSTHPETLKRIEHLKKLMGE